MEDKKDIVEEVKEEVEKELNEGKQSSDDKILKPPKFINATNLKFVDISTELFREYLYANGAKLRVELPLKLSIDRSGLHRVFDSQGLSYTIQPGWLSIVSKAKEGQPNFIM